MSAPRTARRIVISGRVQGVGFRYALADEARGRNLGGWVRNRRDGTVEALLAGPQDDVEAVIAWARQGPPRSRSRPRRPISSNSTSQARSEHLSVGR